MHTFCDVSLFWTVVFQEAPRAPFFNHPKLRLHLKQLSLCLKQKREVMASPNKELAQALCLALFPTISVTITSGPSAVLPPAVSPN